MTPPERRLPLVRTGQALVLGAVAALGLAPYGLWPATVLALACIPWLLRGIARAGQAGWIGWGLATGYFAHGLAWIVEPFLVDVARHGWMAPFALAFLAGGLALFWAAAFWGAFRVTAHPAGRLWALILAVSLAELARAYVLTGFPWAALAQVWVGTGAVLLLAWIGPHGLALLTLLTAVLPGQALLERGPVPRRLSSLLPAAVLAAGSFWAARGAPDAYPAVGTVRLVQPNAPQHQKWDPDMIPVFFERQVGFTAERPHPDLIVWPETAVPTLLDYAGPALEVIAEAAGGTPLALGIQRTDGRRSYNSLVKLDGTGQVAAIYDKHHLVPFGEYFPGGDLAASFGLRGFAAREGDGFSAGSGPRVMDFGTLGLALPLICYEAVFPQDMRGTGARPDFLLQITNDAWFGKNAGPYQHLAQARMRAIEQGLPMVRVANTGISAMIDPRGGIIASLPLGEAGFVDAGLPAPLAPTLYARSGDWPVLPLLLAGLLAAGLTRGRKIKSA
ncbi:apolipoprotein N-acyltransferase [Sedimentitalea sp. JM2-8]|uniref:Apolipoprotein N-acyltransferase n=1 Tax=Sedimentitalea xiamensis TaxID=3050037 RepID=A0ABT7FFK6_9RHOB|nr:apolipoprotein N-acyltransferase [Sedimentitalea xiamensis]MDK3073921.1 apolipoprotein N-acyltransferase [Sedimentitalea xiamensis]